MNLPEPRSARGQICIAARRLFTTYAVFLAGTCWAAEVDPDFQSAPLLATRFPGRVQVLTDGSFLVFAGFNRLNAEDKGPLLKFSASGSWLPAFRMSSGASEVVAVAELPNGKLLVASYEVEKARTIYRLRRLNSDGSPDGSFNAGAGADGRIYAITVLADGKVLVGGLFQTFNGQERQGLVRLHPDGALDPSFAALRFYDSGVLSNIVVQPDGKILIGGLFYAINETGRDGIARLNGDGMLDEGFVPELNRTNNFTLGTRAIALQPDGRILITGRFLDTTVIPVFPTSPLLRLNSNGTTDRYFAGRTGSGSPPLMSTLVLLPNGNVIGAGDRLYEYLADGSLASGTPLYTFNPPTPTMARQSNGKLLLGAIFGVNGTNTRRIERFSAALAQEPFDDGGYASELAPPSLSTRSDGMIFVSAFNVNRVGTNVFDGVARLLPNGSFDPSFNGSVHGISSPWGVALQPDATTVVFRGSSTTNGESPGEYERLLSNDAPDPTFQSDGSLTFSDLTATAGGKYFALKRHSPYGVLDNNALRRLTPTGQLDNTFQCGVNFSEEAQFGSFLWVGDNQVLARYPDGRLLLRYFDRTGAYRLKRLLPEGAVDASFAAGSVPAVAQATAEETVVRDVTPFFRTVTRARGLPLNDAELLPDGKVIVTGMFDQYNGVPAHGIVRVNENGSVDGTFAAGGGAQWTFTTADATHIPRIDAIERLIGGQFLIAGDFEAYDGHAAPGIARLNADGSFDASFVPPVARPALDPFYPSEYISSQLDASAASQLVTQPDRSVLLSGNFAPANSSSPRAIMRLKEVGDTALLNVSTRLRVEAGDNVLIGGFIITGSEPKQVIIRAIGPSLTNFGITEALANPTLELRDASQALVAENDDWRQTQEAAIFASGVPPSHDLESAIVATLEPGAYTAIVRGIGPSGVGLVEVYDLTTTSASRLANISTRGLVTTGQNVMIGGFISGPDTTRVAIRAVGPSLGAFGIQNPLPDPILELRDANGEITMTNNDWEDDPAQAQELQDRDLAPGDSREAALIATISGGGHTAIVRDANGAQGVAIVEVYRLQ